MREAVKLKSLNLNLRNSLPNRIKSKVKRDLVHFVNPNAYFRGLLAKQIPLSESASYTLSFDLDFLRTMTPAQTF